MNINREHSSCQTLYHFVYALEGTLGLLPSTLSFFVQRDFIKRIFQTSAPQVYVLLGDHTQLDQGSQPFRDCRHLWNLAKIPSNLRLLSVP